MATKKNNKFAQIVSQAAQLVSRVGWSTHNAIRLPNGDKGTTRSGNRFARMTKADAEQFYADCNSGKICGISPFGAIVIVSVLSGENWKDVRNAVAGILCEGDTCSLGTGWNETLGNAQSAVAGLNYAAAQLSE